MANCTKCGTAVDHPQKTWKIKQTQVALFECPSCKAKWRSKYTDIPIVQQTIQTPIIEDKESIKTPIELEKIENNTPLMEEIRTVADDMLEPEKPMGIFSEIRAFFTNLFSER